MQTVSSDFTTRTDGKIRPLSWSLLMSFTKAYDPDVDFFTIGDSTIGGTDIIKGESNVVQEWDRYVYEDFTDRVLSIEYERIANPPTNALTLGTADIVLDNHDDIFTPGNTASPLDGYLLPKRPIRISLGFKGELIPVFIGLTQKRPEIDEKAKTVKFHCLDFLSYMMDQPLDEEVMYVDMRTDEIIQSLLEGAGVLASQMDLDTGSVIIPFAYFAKGKKRGEALQEIAEAELGNISMSESGRPTFQNRTNWSDNTSSWTFSKDSVLERETQDDQNIINVVEVYSQARAVRAKQKIWELESPEEVKSGATLELFVDFKDDYGALPVTTLDDPEYITTADTSKYATNAKSDGTGEALNAYITLDSVDLFSTSAKLVFSNSHPSLSVFITQLELFATPAKVQNDIYIREVDPVSVGEWEGYEEKVHKIENDFIQDETAAKSIAKIILGDRATNDDQQLLLVKGVPQLQISDVVTWDETDQTDDFFVTRISGTLNKSGFRQRVGVSQRTIESYFRIGVSTIGGSDKIGP